MSFPGESLMENYGSVRGRESQNQTVREAYEEGKICVTLYHYISVILAAHCDEVRYVNYCWVILNF